MSEAMALGVTERMEDGIVRNAKISAMQVNNDVGL